MSKRDGTRARAARELARRYLSHTVTRNIGALYGLQMINYVGPVITIPYLTRVLGVREWGLVAFAQAYESLLLLLLEYGFALSAAREVARKREDAAAVRDLVAGVLGAKALLALCATGVSMGIVRVVPIFRDHPAFMWWALIQAIFQSLSFTWYFLGMERLSVVTRAIGVGNVVSIVAVFISVRHRGEGVRVLIAAATGFGISSAVTAYIAYRRTGFRAPRLGSAIATLRAGWSMFVFRSFVTFYTTANGFILGLFSGPRAVALYIGAEKISKALFGLLQPISQALFPRVSRQISEGARRKAAREAQLSLSVMSGLSVLIGVVVFVGAPFVIRVALGPGFDAAVPVLRVLAVLPLFITVSNVLGMQWMLPMAMDREVNLVISCAALVNVVLATQLASRYAQMGMAWAVVISETFVALAMYALLRRRRLDPRSIVRAG